MVSSLVDTSDSLRPGDSVALVTDQLRNLILEGEFQPGQRLVQGDLAAKLGAGRTPLREAVRTLQAEGLLISSANRGVTVSSVTLESVEEVYGIRLLLEAPLSAALIARFGEEQLAGMEACLEEMASLRTRHRDFQRAHRDFHQAQLDLYGEETSRMIEQIHRRVFWHQRVYMSRPSVPEDFIDLDQLTFDAIRARDETLVRRATEFHLIDAALGLILDVDPDHQFGPLLTAVTGAGIALDVNDRGQIARPSSISWSNGPINLPALKTTNLVFTP